MMSRSDNRDAVNDETLSAYFDGELSAERRSEVERWLSRSSDARLRLEEYERLSGLLRELPRAELPSEFASQVLQQAERQMLLPVASAPSKWRRARFWTLSVVGPLTAAAALLFIALQWRQAPEAPGVARAKHGAVEHAPVTVASANREPAQVAVESASAAAEAPRLARSDGAKIEIEAAAQSRHDSSAEVVAANARTADGKQDSVPLAALVEEVQKANERGQTPVVRVYVVDRREGMELVQVVFDRHHIPRDRSLAAPSGKTIDVESRPGPKPEEPLAVDADHPADRDALFVVADADELRGALHALLAQHERALTWKLDAPIDLHQFDRRSQARIEEALSALGQVSPGRDTAGEAGRSPTEETKLAAAEPADPVAKEEPAETKSAARSSTFARPGAGLAAVDSPKAIAQRTSRAGARQLRVTLAEPVPSFKSDRARAADAPPAAAPPAAPQSTSRAHQSDAAASRPPLVRVIVVIEPQSAEPVDRPPPAIR